jgi:flagellar biosynthetic protein FlhB
MSQFADHQEKTEEPTARKLEMARAEGHVARSQEVSNWFLLLALALIIGLVLPGLFPDFGAFLTGFLSGAHDLPLDAGQLVATARASLLSLLALLALPMLIVVGGALCAAFLQNGFLFTVEPVKPKLSNIGLKRGMKKIFSLNAVVEFVKGILKLLIVGSVVGVVIWPDRTKLMAIPAMETAQFLELLRMSALKVAIAVLAVMTVVAVLDVLYQRYQHRKGLRMTKQEIKDENKQTEGDPKVKARLGQTRTERSRQRMMASVPDADVVITNLTHNAVALKYDQATMEAPRLVAKGVDSLAQRIRALAKENNIPIVENAPLARALHGGAEINQEIPAEHHKAVAEVIGYVMRLRARQHSAQLRVRRARA